MDIGTMRVGAENEIFTIMAGSHIEQLKSDGF
jgi:hypothetical protein